MPKGPTKGKGRGDKQTSHHRVLSAPCPSRLEDADPDRLTPARVTKSRECPLKDMEIAQVTAKLAQRSCAAKDACTHADPYGRGTQFKEGQIVVFCPLMHYTHPECRVPRDKRSIAMTSCPTCWSLSSQVTPSTRFWQHHCLPRGSGPTVYERAREAETNERLIDLARRYGIQ